MVFRSWMFCWHSWRTPRAATPKTKNFTPLLSRCSTSRLAQRLPTTCPPKKKKGKAKSRQKRHASRLRVGVMEMRSDKSHDSTGFSHIFQDCLQLGLAFQWLKHPDHVNPSNKKHEPPIFPYPKFSLPDVIFSEFPWRCHHPKLPLLSFETAAQYPPKIPGAGWEISTGGTVPYTLTYQLALALSLIMMIWNMENMGNSVPNEKPSNYTSFIVNTCLLLVYYYFIIHVTPTVEGNCHKTPKASFKKNTPSHSSPQLPSACFASKSFRSTLEIPLGTLKKL